MRQQIPLLITFIVGTLLIVSVFIPPFGDLETTFNIWFDIIAVFAFFLGGGNLIRVHIDKLRSRKRDWPFSIVTLLGFSLMLTDGLFKINNPGDISSAVDAPGSLFYDIFK